MTQKVSCKQKTHANHSAVFTVVTLPVTTITTSHKGYCSAFTVVYRLQLRWWRHHVTLKLCVWSLKDVSVSQAPRFRAYGRVLGPGVRKINERRTFQEKKDEMSRKKLKQNFWSISSKIVWFFLQNRRSFLYSALQIPNTDNYTVSMS